MKISTLVSVALVGVVQFTTAIPLSVPSIDNVTLSEENPRWITVRGAGHLHEQHLIKRNTNGRVTGVRVGNSGAYKIPRQEIRELIKNQNGRIFDLYVLALARLQGRGTGDMNGYYQLAGIHGRPYQPWNNRQAGAPNSDMDPRYGGGYCTHGSTLFPTWHRPYLAYFEEILWANAQQVVNLEKNAAEKAKWTEALMFFRMPYWDWALYGGEVPSMLLQSTWKFKFYPNIYTASKMPTIANPLYSYAFVSNSQRVLTNEQPWVNWPRTLRRPYSTSPTTASNVNEFNNVMKSNGPSRRQRVHQLLLKVNTWAAFSNRVGSSNSGSNFDSLEAIHDGVHVDVGGQGHMSSVPYSAFDPVFFLHHTNVDRLFAMWQAIHWDVPNEFATRQTNQGGTYGIPPGRVDDINTHLEPFLGLSGQPYNSGATVDTSLFGYSYIDVPKHKYKLATNDGKRLLGNFVRSRVESLYGGSVSKTATKRKRDVSDASAIDAGIDKSIIGANQYYEWKINLVADKSALNGTYTVHFFLGRPSRDPAQWSTQKEHVGDYSVFTHTHQAAPGIDPAEINNNVTGSVPLTEAMVASFDTTLKSLKPNDAISFLVKNLRWRITDVEGKPHRVKDVKGLVVSVWIALSTLPSPEQPWTEYGDWTFLAEITRKIGRDGGPDQVGIIPTISSTTVSTSASTETTSEPTSTTEALVETTTEIQSVEVPTTTTSIIENLLPTSTEVLSTTTSEASTPTGA